MNKKAKNEDCYKKIIQRICGIILLIASVIFYLLIRNANEDGTALLVIVPLGLYLLFTKNIIID